jgi:Pvc16 N-terminal domain
MSTVTAIQGVDEILYALSTAAVSSLTPKPDITVGPLDGDEDTLRLNWFLYRVSPDPTYRSMEPPTTGWRTSRGNPPLALRLSYLLSAFPAAKTAGGDQEQFAHVGLAAVMQAVYENAIVGDSSPVLTPALATFVDPLIEPIRIALDDLDLEAVTKIWTAASKPIRLSVGYGVSVVLIEPKQKYLAGPPVKTRRIGLAPSLGPRLVAVSPSRTSFGDDFDVEVEGLTNGSVFTLAHDTADPPGPDWPMTVVPGAPTGHVTLSLPDPNIAPGLRELDVSATENGLPFGHDAIAMTVVPALTGAPNPVPKNTGVSLQTAHAAPDVEVFVRGKRVDSVTFVSPVQVDVVIPTATPSGPADVVLRAGKVAGPMGSVTLA